MSDPKDSIEKIGRVEAKSGVAKVEMEEPLERVPPNKERFDALMSHQTPAITPADLSEMAPKKAQLLEEVREVGGRIDLLKRKTPEELVAQAKDVVAQIDDIKQKLKHPDLQLDQSDQIVMRNKLSNIDDKLRVVMESVGAEYTPLEVKEAKNSLRTPVERFLGVMENAEVQIRHMYQSVSVLGAEKGMISPQALLVMQVKMGFIQQQLEFFTNVMNKSLEATKTLMNVQV